MKSSFILILLIMIIKCSSGHNRSEDIQKISDTLISQGYEICDIINNRYIIYGIVDSTISSNKKIYSVFNIIDNKYTNDSLKYSLSSKLFCNHNRSDCMNTYIEYYRSENRIYLINYLNLPIEKNWEDSFCPILKMSLDYDNDSIFSYKTEFILTSDFSNNTNELLKEYNNIKFTTSNLNDKELEYFVSFIMRLFVSALYEQDCRKNWDNLTMNIPCFGYGELGELYYSLNVIFKYLPY